MTDTGALGDVVGGALAARAVEPAAGSAAHARAGHAPGDPCLNCGTALIGRNCHECGQAGEVHHTLRAFGHDLAHGMFHFEGKIWRTLPLLAWHPGRLTREYIDGRRARYVSPIALFLFTVFVTFALFSLVIGKNGHLIGSDGVVVGPQAGQVRINQEIAGLEVKRAAAVRAGQPTASIDEEIAGDREAVARLNALTQSGALHVHAKGYSRGGQAVADRINAAVRHAIGNPDLVSEQLETNAHKYSWLLIPLSVPFVWLLFPFSRRFGLYDHTVFVTYSLSFMLLLLAGMALAAQWGFGWLAFALMLYAPLHMHRQLRGAYMLGHRAALWRTCVLSVVAAAVLLVWIVAIVVVVFAG